MTVARRRKPRPTLRAGPGVWGLVRRVSHISVGEGHHFASCRSFFIFQAIPLPHQGFVTAIRAATAPAQSSARNNDSARTAPLLLHRPPFIVRHPAPPPTFRRRSDRTSHPAETQAPVRRSSEKPQPHAVPPKNPKPPLRLPPVFPPPCPTAPLKTAPLGSPFPINPGVVRSGAYVHGGWRSLRRVGPSRRRTYAPSSPKSNPRHGPALPFQTKPLRSIRPSRNPDVVRSGAYVHRGGGRSGGPPPCGVPPSPRCADGEAVPRRDQTPAARSDGIARPRRIVSSKAPLGRYVQRT